MADAETKLTQDLDLAAEGREPLLPHIRLHDLRHTYATLALQSGENIKVVSTNLGHADVTITMDIYTDVLADAKAEAAQRISDYMFGAAD